MHTHIHQDKRLIDAGVAAPFVSEAAQEVRLLAGAPIAFAALE